MKKYILMLLLSVYMQGCYMLPDSPICDDWRQITFVEKGSWFGGHEVQTQTICVLREKKTERPKGSYMPAIKSGWGDKE